MGAGSPIPPQSPEPQGMGGTATGFPTTNVLPQYAAQLGSAPLAVPNPTQQMLPNQAASLASFQGARAPTLGQPQQLPSPAMLQLQQLSPPERVAYAMEMLQPQQISMARQAQQLPPPQQPMRGLGGLQNYMQPNMARFLQRRARMARALPRKG